MRDHIILYINGRSHRVTGETAFLTLSDYLRNNLRMTGTKIVCSEGDCGSCSVLMAGILDADPIYEPIDSCIAFMFQLDGRHIITVEGLGDESNLSPVQRAMIDCHGSQCGFCTPGFVTTMTGMIDRATASQTKISDEQWRCGLAGNLCRCTGYASILAAGLVAMQENEGQRLESQYPSEPMRHGYHPYAQDEVEIIIKSEDSTRIIFCPVSLESAIALRSIYPASRFVAGGTDVGVQVNKWTFIPEVIISLNRIESLKQTVINDDSIRFGSGVTWAEMLPYCQQHLPNFCEIVEVFGSPQVRHMGTIGGNIANASPIADSLPLLHVMHCELEITGAAGCRVVDINDFYKGYKQIDLQPDELITAVTLPILSSDESVRLYKVSRRRDMDISTFTAAVRLKIVDQTIHSAMIAMGAVGPVVLRLPQTEAFLEDEPFCLETMQQAGHLAVQEIAPISDVRGSADYRLQLARNIFVKFYYQSLSEMSTT